MEWHISDAEIEKSTKKVINTLANNNKFRNCHQEDIEDAVQNALTKFCEAVYNNDRIERFNSKKVFDAWLYKVAHNELVDILRKNNKFTKQEDGDSEQEEEQIYRIFGEFLDDPISFFEGIIDEEDNLRKDKIIANFWEILCKQGNWDSIEKIILQRHYIDGIELDTLANELDKSPNSFYIRNNRMKDKIRDIMKKNKIRNVKDLDF